MSTPDDAGRGGSMLRSRALRLGAAVVSGPAVVVSLMAMDFDVLEAYSGPLWLDAELLIEETIFSYNLTLMLAVSLLAYRLLVPERPLAERTLFLPLLLWGFQSAVNAHRTFFGPSGEPGFLLFIVWMVGIVTFLGLGCVFLLALPGFVGVEQGRPGRRRRRIARIRLRSLALAAVVVTTVFVDWVLVSTQVNELRIVPALRRAEAIEAR